LVVLGVFGFFVELAAGDAASGSGMSKLLRMFRVLRLVRLTRLVRYFLVIKAWMVGKSTSKLMADHLKEVTILKAFVAAHCEAHDVFMQFFGVDGMVYLPEEAHCLLDSQLSTYTALCICTHLVRSCDPSVITGLDILLDTSLVAKELEEFIDKAFEAGILNTREAETMIHPLRDHERKVRIIFGDERQGIHSNYLQQLHKQHVRETCVPGGGSHKAKGAGHMKGVASEDGPLRFESADAFASSSTEETGGPNLRVPQTTSLTSEADAPPAKDGSVRFDTEANCSTAKEQRNDGNRGLVMTERGGTSAEDELITLGPSIVTSV